MIKVFLAIIVLIGIISCSSLNRESQEYISLRNDLRHGIIPIDKKEKSNIKRVKRPIDMISVKRGKELYRKNCYSCHGAEGSGTGPKAKNLGMFPRNLKEAAKQVPNFKFYMMVSQWEGEMPGWVNKLNDKELRDIENYIKYLVKEKG